MLEVAVYIGMMIFFALIGGVIVILFIAFPLGEIIKKIFKFFIKFILPIYIVGFLICCILHYGFGVI